jgi:hypothetical protein
MRVPLSDSDAALFNIIAFNSSAVESLRLPTAPQGPGGGPTQPVELCRSYVIRLT